MGTAATCFAGIGVSKDAPDCCRLVPGGRAKEHTSANDPPGHAAPLWPPAGIAPQKSLPVSKIACKLSMHALGKQKARKRGPSR